MAPEENGHQFIPTHREKCSDWTRKYYYSFNKGFIKCNMCKRVLKVSHGDARAGIIRHIKNKHPFVYYKEKKQDLLVEDDSQFQTENTTEKIFLVNKVASEDDNIDFQEGESVESSVDSSTEWSPVEGEAEQALTEELMTRSKDSSTVKKRIQNNRGHWTWKRKYYVKISDKYIKCRICHVTLKFHHSNNGRHLERKHPDIFYKEMNMFVSKRVARRKPATQNTEDVKQSLYSNESDEIVTKGTNSEVQVDQTLESNVDKRADVADATQANALTEEQIKLVAEKTVSKRSHDTSNNRRIRSWTRKYCHRISEKMIKCNICNRVMFLNIHRHIRRKHPEVYSMENPQIRETDDDVELWIKNQCAQNTTEMTSRSCFWNFFDVIEKNKLYECRFCNKTIKGFPNVHNLKKHIRIRHRSQYNIIMKYERFKTNDPFTVEGEKGPEGVTSVEIAFVSMDEGNKFKCSRCDTILECTEEENEAVLVAHVQECQLAPVPVQEQIEHHQLVPSAD